MIGRRTDQKILFPIIARIAVDMMHQFFWLEGSAQGSTGNYSMLRNIAETISHRMTRHTYAEIAMTQNPLALPRRIFISPF